MHLTERSFGRFQRSFRLPYRPDPGQVQAQFDKGVLRIILPQPAQQQTGGRIQIQAAGGQNPARIEGAQGRRGPSPGFWVSVYQTRRKTRRRPSQAIGQPLPTARACGYRDLYL